MNYSDPIDFAINSIRNRMGKQSFYVIHDEIVDTWKLTEDQFFLAWKAAELAGLT